MTTITMVRHGRAAAGWDDHHDPPLDALGEQQAAAVAARLAPAGPVAIVTSPMQRCRQTAAALSGLWGVTPTVAPAVSEIPSPDGVPTDARVAWLRETMRSTWSDLGERYVAYRDGVVAYLLGLPTDTIVFSHFVAINVAIGAAIGDDRVLIHRLDNCSATVLAAADGRLRLIEAGHEADTLIR